MRAVSRCQRDDIELLVLSLRGDEDVPDDPRIVALPYEMVPREEYVRRLAAVDALVMPFDPDGEMLTWRAAGLDLALADATMPFFMQWDRPEQYPGHMPARHPNGARRVARIAITPSDEAKFARWTEGADARTERAPEGEPGIWSVGVETDQGELTIRG